MRVTECEKGKVKWEKSKQNINKGLLTLSSSFPDVGARDLFMQASQMVSHGEIQYMGVDKSQ